MSGRLHVEIVTQHGPVFDGDAEGVVAPGLDGYFGVLPRHAPLIAEMGPGELRVNLGDRTAVFAVSGGIFHVRDRRAVVMAEAVEAPDGIDVDRARQAAKRARERLKGGHKDPSVDVARAQLALMRALNRLRVAGGGGIDT